MKILKYLNQTETNLIKSNKISQILKEILQIL